MLHANMNNNVDIQHQARFSFYDFVAMIYKGLNSIIGVH